MADTIPDHDRLVRLETLVETAVAEVAVLRGRAHDFANTMQVALGETKALKDQVSAIAVSLAKLIDVVNGFAAVPARVDKHEEVCVEAARKTEAHFVTLEQKIDEASASREAGFRRLQDQHWRAAIWVIGILTSAIGALCVVVWLLLKPLLHIG